MFKTKNDLSEEIRASVSTRSSQEECGTGSGLAHGRIECRSDAPVTPPVLIGQATPLRSATLALTASRFPVQGSTQPARLLP
jgi:hypothetical protein